MISTQVNAAPDLADRAELRAQLHSAGLGRALAGVAAAVGGGGADADAAAAEELEAQLRVYEAVAADDAQRVAAAAGAAGFAPSPRRLQLVFAQARSRPSGVVLFPMSSL